MEGKYGYRQIGSDEEEFRDKSRQRTTLKLDCIDGREYSVEARINHGFRWLVVHRGHAILRTSSSRTSSISVISLAVNAPSLCLRI